MSRRFKVYLGGTYPDEEIAGEATLGGSYSYTEWLEPIYISQTANGEIGELRVIGHKHPEDAYNTTHVNQAVRVLDFKDNPSGVQVFTGVLVKEHIVFQGAQELYEAVAYNNADYFLYRKVLHGQKRLNHTQEQLYVDSPTQPSSTNAIALELGDWIDIDTPLIFNPEAQPNMMKQIWWSEDMSTDDNNPFHLFDRPLRFQAKGTTGSGGSGSSSSSGGSSSSSGGSDKVIEAQYWTLKDAVQYLLTLQGAKWAIAPSSYNKTALSIFDTYGNPRVSNVNLEGRRLLEGLRLLLEPHNYGFWCSMATTTGVQHTINFYFRGSGTEKTIDLSVRNTNAGDSDANLIGCDVVYDYTATVNSITAVGDRKSFTTLAQTNPTAPDPLSGQSPVLTLSKGWDDDDLVWPTANPDGSQNTYDTRFRKDYCHPSLITINDAGDAAYGVGRLWVVNQGENPQVDLEDLTVDLNDNADGHCSIDPRRLEKPELYDRNSAGGVLNQEDIQVEVSFDQGDNWCVIEKSWYRVIAEGMGIVFVDPKMEKLGLRCPNSIYPDGWTYWDSLHDDTLDIRILCSVKSDERLVINKYNDGSRTHLATEGLFQNDAYKKVKYNNAALDSVFFTTFAPLKNNQNDTAALQEVTDIQWTNSNRVMTTGTAVVVLEGVNDYVPGDSITGVANRLDFPDFPSVVRVVYDLTNLHVQLALDSRRVATIVRAAHQDADTLQGHKLGIGQTGAAGGTQVPYLQGNKESLRTYIRGEGNYRNAISTGRTSQELGAARQ